jgi:hypothetical protein
VTDCEDIFSKNSEVTYVERLSINQSIFPQLFFINQSSISPGRRSTMENKMKEERNDCSLLIKGCSMSVQFCGGVEVESSSSLSF